MRTGQFVAILLGIGVLASALGGALVALIQDAECPMRADPELCGRLGIYIPLWGLVLLTLYVVTVLPIAIVARAWLRRRPITPRG